MDIFKQVRSVNLWADLSHLWLLPRVFKAVPKEKLCLPQPVWYSISLITRYPRMYWDLTLGVSLTKHI